jgi:hypothetical protein
MAFGQHLHIEAGGCDLDRLSGAGDTGRIDR